MQIEVRQKPDGSWTVFAPGWPMAHEATEAQARETFSDAARVIIQNALDRADVIVESREGRGDG